MPRAPLLARGLSDEARCDAMHSVHEGRVSVEQVALPDLVDPAVVEPGRTGFDFFAR